MFAEAFKPTDPSKLTQLISACAVSGAAAAFLTTPLDTVKIRMQVGTLKTGTLGGLKKIYQTEGLHGLFRGGVPRIAFNSLNTVVTMVTMELIRAELTRRHKGGE